MRRNITFLTVTLLAGLMSFSSAQTTTAPAGAERKVTFRTAPKYPELAQKAHLQGVVKVEAVVRPNGTVKSTRVVGGNPVLVDAATEAVTKWKFEPGSNETTEMIQLTFVPQ
jgi:TonB family protein